LFITPPASSYSRTPASAANQAGTGLDPGEVTKPRPGDWEGHRSSRKGRQDRKEEEKLGTKASGRLLSQDVPLCALSDLCVKSSGRERHGSSRKGRQDRKEGNELGTKSSGSSFPFAPLATFA